MKALLLLLTAVLLASAQYTWTDISVNFQGEIPPGRFAHTQEVNLEGNLMLIFGGRGAGWETFHNDSYIYDFSTGKWEKYLQALDDSPGDRYATSDFHYDNQTYIFGGAAYIWLNETEDLQVAYDDLYRFDFGLVEWFYVNYTGDLEDWPPPRYGCVMEAIGNDAYLFGGREVCGGPPQLPCPEDNIWQFDTYLNDTWKLDMQTHTWTQVLTTTAPDNRYSMLSFLYEDKFYIWAGRSYRDGTLLFNDLWEFDPAAEEWIEVATANPPPARYSTSGVFYDGRFFVFGGAHTFPEGGWGWLNDSWVLNMTTLEWNELAPIEAPVAREGMRASLHGTKMIIFGGKTYHRADEEIDYNDIWELDLDTIPAVFPEVSSSVLSEASLSSVVESSVVSFSDVISESSPESLVSDMSRASSTALAMGLLLVACILAFL